MSNMPRDGSLQCPIIDPIKINRCCLEPNLKSTPSFLLLVWTEMAIFSQTTKQDSYACPPVDAMPTNRHVVFW
uniref:Uncharacterized protein n=1 Tax=Ditylenchus dipsaci TaxID=166011 RepID=A0A915DUJ5_9BILA